MLLGFGRQDLKLGCLHVYFSTERIQKAGKDEGYSVPLSVKKTKKHVFLLGSILGQNWIHEKQIDDSGSHCLSLTINSCKITPGVTVFVCSGRVQSAVTALLLLKVRSSSSSFSDNSSLIRIYTLYLQARNSGLN